eukprot:gnl/MRDRNA2_/MRDRNA2_72481_c0_seq1.p1 gnl/MRDRNA2_/MRDRNA2_72481_c0~~gnl/MRDRNA2_/MRDRNA2_72481_c0_seq1.p1  ORF type:complete len:531 (-),score=139.81 gnl/MRDRNA2_/MRDRNA2_72481_c0_seq1:114-1706(-)
MTGPQANYQELGKQAAAALLLSTGNASEDDGSDEEDVGAPELQKSEASNSSKAVLNSSQELGKQAAAAFLLLAGNASEDDGEKEEGEITSNEENGVAPEREKSEEHQKKQIDKFELEKKRLAEEVSEEKAKLISIKKELVEVRAEKEREMRQMEESIGSKAVLNGFQAACKPQEISTSNAISSYSQDRTDAGRPPTLMVCDVTTGSSSSSTKQCAEDTAGHKLQVINERLQATPELDIGAFAKELEPLLSGSPVVGEAYRIAKALGKAFYAIKKKGSQTAKDLISDWMWRLEPVIDPTVLEHCIWDEVALCALRVALRRWQGTPDGKHVTAAGASELYATAMDAMSAWRKEWEPIRNRFNKGISSNQKAIDIGNTATTSSAVMKVDSGADMYNAFKQDVEVAIRMRVDPSDHADIAFKILRCWTRAVKACSATGPDAAKKIVKDAMWRCEAAMDKYFLPEDQYWSKIVDSAFRNLLNLNLVDFCNVQSGFAPPAVWAEQALQDFRMEYLAYSSAPKQGKKRKTCNEAEFA